PSAWPSTSPTAGNTLASAPSAKDAPATSGGAAVRVLGSHDGGGRAMRDGLLALLCRKLFHSDRSVRIGWNELRIRRRRAAPVDRILLGNRRCAQQQDPARVVRDVRAGAPGQRREEERGADRGHGDGGPGGVRAGPPPAAAFPARFAVGGPSSAAYRC